MQIQRNSDRLEQYRKRRIKRRILNVFALIVLGTLIYFLYDVIQNRYGI